MNLKNSVQAHELLLILKGLLFTKTVNEVHLNVVLKFHGINVSVGNYVKTLLVLKWPTLV